MVFNQALSPQAHQVASDSRLEYVLKVSGVVEVRPAGTENPNLATGGIEVAAESAEVLNAAKTPPFDINQDDQIDEQVRLRYRYLDLRRDRMRGNLVLRHRMVKAIRDWLDSRGFLEVETPILVKETPGGAREFLVPSRVQPGCFYALPQSPQQYKQLLMVAGVERYFQIARCFRDEDLRADRQLEFTQLDVEMSFVDQEDVLALTEALMIDVVRSLDTKAIASTPFPHLTFAEAMERYGSDKPDLRFGLPVTDVSDLVSDSGFRLFVDAVAAGNRVKALRAPGCGGYTRSQLDDLSRLAQTKGARGLLTMALGPDGVRGQLARNLPAPIARAVADRLEAEPGDLLMLVADESTKASEVLGEMRLEMGRRLNLMPRDVLHFCWVTDMPALEWNAERQHYQAKHHQFTTLFSEDWPLLDTDPLAVRAKQYDLVCNGYELGGGSIRIHRREQQAEIFRRIGMTDEQANEMFGHLLEAFEYGTPPHGGIALGLDRVSMLLAGEESIREMIAFPKTASAMDLMTGSPSPVPAAELGALHIRVADDVAPPRS